jgi:hypothetical protein
LFPGWVLGLDVPSNGSIVVGGSLNYVIAHNTATGAELWHKKIPSNAHTLRIYGGVVVVPVDKRSTVVLDVTTGHQLHTLPSAGHDAHGICVFDGLASDVVGLLIFHS